MNENTNVEVGIELLLPGEEQIIEFKWQGKLVEIFFNNYISSEEGFFLWEDLDEKAKKIAESLFNVTRLAELQTCLATKST